MSPITIHPSQLPTAECEALLAALADGRVSPRLLYHTRVQSERWLQVFNRWAPYGQSPECRRVYADSSRDAADGAETPCVLVALGCGDGSKDVAMLAALHERRRLSGFVPVDVSEMLVERAALRADPWLTSEQVHPVVADLCRAPDLNEWLNERLGGGAPRILTFYGMIPNFEPHEILPALGDLVREGDRLLFSANMIPRAGEEAVRGVLHQYDNPETRTWLLSFFEAHRARVNPGGLSIDLEADPRLPGILRIVADYRFMEPGVVTVCNRAVEFVEGGVWRLFCSYRYTEEQLRDVLQRFGFLVESSWITASGEEGVFLCARG